MILENIALIDVFKIIAVIALVVALIIPKKKEYEYTKLDKAGVILNIILSILYIPISLIGIFTVFFADAPAAMSELKENMMVNVIYTGVTIPLISIGCVFSSILSRKRGKSKFSFYIQFLPLLIFIIMMVMAFIMLSME